MKVRKKYIHLNVIFTNNKIRKILNSSAFLIIDITIFWDMQMCHDKHLTKEDNFISFAEEFSISCITEISNVHLFKKVSV